MIQNKMRYLIHLFLIFPVLALSADYEVQDGLYRGLKLGADTKLEACEVIIKKDIDDNDKIFISLSDKEVQTLYRDKNSESAYLYENEHGYQIFQYTDGPAFRNPSVGWDCVMLKPISLIDSKLGVNDASRSDQKEGNHPTMTIKKKPKSRSALKL